MNLNMRTIFKALVVIVGVALLMHPSIILCSIGNMIWIAGVYMLANFVSLVCFHKSLKRLFLEDED